MGHTLKINTEHSTYSVFLGNDVFDELKKIITEVKPTKVCVVTDEIVRALHLHTLLGQLPAGLDYCTFVAPAGENAKSLQIYEKLVSYCIEQGLDRKSLLIALGGGAIGDLTGFAAATFMRGIPYIQVPTTILAHDSSVGGKTGLNLKLGKNLIGAFYHPLAVVYYLPFIDTLPEKEKLSGFAEIIKEAFIDPQPYIVELMNEFHSINDLISTKLLQPIVQGITTKKKYVEEDERESGVRAFLNLGHTLGHAIEKESGYGKITHGEAVIIGIIYALRLSEAIFKQPFSLSIDDFISWLQQLGYRTDLPQELTIDQLIQTMKHDKKTISGTLRFVLLQKEGQPILYEVDEEVISGHLHKVFRK